MSLITNESIEGSYLEHLRSYKKQLLINGYDLEAEDVQLEINDLEKQ